MHSRAYTHSHNMSSTIETKDAMVEEDGTDDPDAPGTSTPLSAGNSAWNVDAAAPRIRALLDVGAGL